jgi:ribose transport system permease protein
VFAAVRQALPQSYLLLVLLGIIVAGFIATPDFLTARNATNVVTFSAIVAVLAVGQFFVVLTGGIDLSVGSVVALSTVIAALLLQKGYPAGVAVLVTLAVCAVVGLLNGVLVVGLRLAPFIATLATMSMVQGVSYIIQSTSLIQITNPTFVTWFSEGAILGIRTPVLIFILVTIVAAFAARYTTFGRRLYAVGGNREAARLSGLPVNRDLLLTYGLSGLLAGLAGLLAAAQLLQGSSLIGQGYELDAIAAVVVGGASLFGGKGNPVGAVIGCFIISIITNIMNLIGISSEPQLVIKGLVIVVAVFLSSAGGVTRISAALASVRGRRAPIAGG